MRASDARASSRRRSIQGAARSPRAPPPAAGARCGQDDLDAGLGVHVHTHPPRSRGAPDDVGDRITLALAREAPAHVAVRLASVRKLRGVTHRPEGTPRGGCMIPPRMPRSIVQLPREVCEPVRGLRQRRAPAAGRRLPREGRTLVFERELRKDRISGWRWLLGAWGVGTYRQDDSVDVRYDGARRFAEGRQRLEIEGG